MSVVTPLETHEVSPEVADLYGRIEQAYGFVPNIVKTLAKCPELLQSFVPLWAQVYQSETIGKRYRAIAALGTAYSQDCAYCIEPMTQSARLAGLDETEITAVANGNYDSLDAPETLILNYAKALTIAPKSITADIQTQLKQHFSDAEFVALTVTVAMYNFTSRVLQGLDIPADQNVSVREHHV